MEGGKNKRFIYDEWQVARLGKSDQLPQLCFKRCCLMFSMGALSFACDKALQSKLKTEGCLGRDPGQPNLLPSV